MRKIIPLNDDWMFLKAFSPNCLDTEFDFSGAEKVNLPHSNYYVPVSYFDDAGFRGVCVYARKLKVPAEFFGSRSVLKFEGILSYCEVYVNGVFVASNMGETPFSADISVPVKYGSDNIIVVKADSTVRKDVPSDGLNGPMICYGGIVRDVYFEAYRGEIIKDVFVRAKPSQEASSNAEIDVELFDFYPGTVLKAAIIDGSGKRVGTLPDKNVLREKTTIKGDIQGVEFWSPENPVIYTAEITLLREEKILDVMRVKFGIKSAVFTRSGFYLNGNLIKLIGLNRFDSFPYFGRATTSNLQRGDVHILRHELGCNVVRTHALASRDFIDECDKEGLMVITDVSGDGYIGKSDWRDNFIQIVERYVKRDRNSASIIAWGVRVNNSPDCDELYFKTNKAASDADPTRMTIGARNFLSSRMYEDIFAYNDYNKKGTISKPAQTGKLFVPYLVSEHTGHMFPVRPYDTEQLKSEQALRHLRVIDKTLGSRKILGAIGMSFADFNSARHHGGGDNINHFGVTDIFRNKKFAAYAYSSQFSKAPVLELSSNLAPEEFDGKLFALTNCDFIKLYRSGRMIGEFYPNKKVFKHLPHPPVFLKDLTGELSEEGFKPWQSKVFKYLLKRVDRKSILSLKRVDRWLLKLLSLSLKYDSDEMDALFIKYSLTPNFPDVFKAEGYKNGEVVITKKFGDGEGKFLSCYCANNKIVCNKSYEIAKITVEAKDNQGNILSGCFDPIQAAASGAVEIVGADKLSFISGRAAIYVRTVSGGAGRVDISSVGQDVNVELEVEYEPVGRI